MAGIMQKKRHSLLEVCVGTAIGFIVAYLANWIVLPWFGLFPSHGEIFWITCVFTVISIVRGYFVRRLFNWIHLKGIL